LPSFSVFKILKTDFRRTENKNDNGTIRMLFKENFKNKFNRYKRLKKIVVESKKLLKLNA